LKGLKNILFGCLVLLLALPMILKLTRFVEIKPLQGSFIEPEEPVFSAEEWFSGSFQTAFEKDFEYHVSFRPLLIRLHNQYLYSLYNTSKTYVVVGQNKQLFAYDYYMAFSGETFVGRDSIRSEYQRLLHLQDSLDKPLLFVIAPNKVRLLAQYLPAGMNTDIRDSVNYPVWLEFLKRGEIAFLDFNALFKELGGEDQTQFFPNTGTHWNSYGMYIAHQYILRKLASMSGDSLIDIHWSGVAPKDSVIDSDRDLVESLNLLYPPPTQAQLYPDFTIEKEGRRKPKALIVGDSFFWNFYGLEPYFGELWDEGSRFWYYNNTEMDMHQARILVPELNAHQTLETKDYLIILATEANLHKVPYGFPQKYFKEDSSH
jgi:hypothetical protein